ncbi:MAG: ABC transporter ATP-binding protein/permease [Clostridium sp.]|nr:ABC transporter ATP-binding protein/permease [Clostridium sp.]
MHTKIKNIFSYFRDVGALLKIVWSIDKWYLIMMPLTIVTTVCQSLVAIIFPKLIIDEITTRKRIGTAIVIVVLMATILFFSKAVQRLVDYLSNVRMRSIRNELTLTIQKKIMTLDYWNLENPEFLNFYQRASGVVTMWQADLQRLLNAIIAVGSSLLIVVGTIYILSVFDVFIFILIVMVVLLSSLLNARVMKAQVDMYKDFAPNIRKMNYLMDELQDNKYAKEIRTYNMKKWLSRKTENVLMRMYKITRKVYNVQIASQGAVLSLNIIQNAAIYAYAGWLSLIGKIAIGDLLMLINAASAFTSGLQNIFSNYLTVKEAGIYIRELIAFMDLKNVEKGYAITLKNTIDYLMDDLTIEFKDVCFKYPNQEKYVLENINIVLSGNETVAIVGDNGVGKTTFVKLLLRLYKPSKGEIFLNGINIWDYALSEYMGLFSVVFQDYKVFAFSILENIVLQKEADVDKGFIDQILKSVGLFDKVQSLPQEIAQHISRSFIDSGIEFSGGEMQQLQIGQALYRNTPILVLDEPTANLSPQEENRIFTYISNLSSDKLSIIVSHRMSCCNISTRVIVFKSDQTIASGTHSKLLETDEFYAHLFNLQAQYYQNI